MNGPDECHILGDRRIGHIVEGVRHAVVRKLANGINRRTDLRQMQRLDRGRAGDDRVIRENHVRCQVGIAVD